MSTLAQRYLRLLENETVPPTESPAQHLRNAIQMLLLAEGRMNEVLIGGDPVLARLLANSLARCFHALFAIGENP